MNRPPASPDAEIARLTKMVKVLMDQVEAGINSHGGDYDLFRTTIMLEDKVRQRTSQLQEAMHSIAEANRDLNLAKEAAELAEMRLSAAVDNISEAFALYDGDDRLALFNDRFRHLWQSSGVAIRVGISFEELATRVVEAGMIEGADAQWLAGRMAAHRSACATREFRLDDGRWIKISERRLQDGGTVGIYADVTDIKRREEERREQELAERSLLLQATLESLSQGVSVFDRDQRLMAWNHRLEDLLRLPPGMLAVGLPYAELPCCAECGGEASALPLLAAFERQLPWGCVLEVQHNPMPNGGFVATWSDITERKAAESRMLHMATHDSLTGQANRALFNDRLQHEIAEARRAGHSVAIHLLDLNNFKAINDTLGHPAGDRMLREVAGRLAPVIREGDLLARLGGDEFAVIQSPVSQPAEARTLAERLLASLKAPFQVEGRPIHTAASVGITLFPSDADTAEVLLRNADIAMYQAKAGAEGGCSFFRHEMDRQVRERKQLEEDMRHGLEAGHFFLVYQPKVRAADGSVSGMEALLRWRHPQRGLVSPADFIPVAEQCGLIVQLGEWALHAACSQMRRWLDRGGRHLRMAVNMSPIQFQRVDPFEAVSAALAGSGLPGEHLEIEITESALISNVAATRAVLDRISGLGVSIAIDDFGTGYSSLGYLYGLPVDKLKIDRLFISNLAADELGQEAGGAIVRAVISLAHALGMDVVAEGVETHPQLKFLRAEGCDEIQGYLFSPAVSAEECEALFAAPARHTAAWGVRAGRCQSAVLSGSASISAAVGPGEGASDVGLAGKVTTKHEPPSGLGS